MITRDELRKAKPSISTATIRYVRGEITRVQYERQVAEERREEWRPFAVDRTGREKI